MTIGEALVWITLIVVAGITGNGKWVIGLLILAFFIA